MSAITTDAAINSVLTAQQGAVQSRIAFSVAAQGLDAQRAQGDAALQLLEAASPAGRAEGLGQQFDAAG